MANKFTASAHVLKTFQTLIKSLPQPESSKPQILFLAGSPTPYRNDTDREILLRQESNFYYLTGCQIPSSYLLASYQHGTPLFGSNIPKVNLFIPKAELDDMMWSIPPPTKEDAAAMFDVGNVRYLEELPGAIKELVKAFPDALFHTLPRNSPLFPDLPEEHVASILRNDGGISDQFLLSALHRARLTKDAHEIELIRKANAISSRAHEVVMRVLGKAVKEKEWGGRGVGEKKVVLPGEWLIEKEAEAEAIFVASCRREGSIHQAYLPIVASSTRASTLHYCCNDKAFAWGPTSAHDHPSHTPLPIIGNHSGNLAPQVLLIDAGCEWDNYASDITRTMPIGNGGKFTEEARAIYELVLEMQKESFAIIKPGLHWDDVQLICHKTLIRGFQKLGIFKTPESSGSGSWNSEEAILASGVTSAFFPHGVGHSLGLDVHDVPSASKPLNNPTINGEALGHPSFYDFLRLRLQLEAGMVVTVEPGIYFSPHLLSPIRDSRHIDHAVLKRYESVGGVRIEDVVVIREGGYENLTTVGSGREWVESVCSGNI